VHEPMSPVGLADNALVLSACNLVSECTLLTFRRIRRYLGMASGLFGSMPLRSATFQLECRPRRTKWK
jgi:hypothetical protein